MGRHVKLERNDFRDIKRRWQKEAFPRKPQPATAANVWGGLAGVFGVKEVLVPVKKQTDG